MRYVENEDIIKDRSLDYVDFIREQPCCVTGRQAEPHHLDALGMGANRNKPNIKHFTCIPLSREIHTELHAKGINYMQEKYRIQFWEEAYYYCLKYFLTKILK